MISILTDPTQDLSSCLVNCSNNGFCTVNTQSKFHCKCLQYFSGPTCNTDIRPCSSNPCINGGNCSNELNDQGVFNGYNCSCMYPYYGVNCEKKIDLCLNQTCSNHGTCQVVNTSETKCSCFSMYLGSQCEIESSKLKAVKKTISAASIVAIAFIVCFYVLIVACDILDFFKKSKRKQMIFRTVIYVPKRGDAIRYVTNE